MTVVIRTLALACALAAAVPAVAPADDGSVHPIVFGPYGYLLGGSANGAWLPAGEVAPMLKGGERYRHYGEEGAVGEGDGLAPESQGQPCPDTMLVEMRTPEFYSFVSVAGGWNALPRVPKYTDVNQRVYREAAAAFLKQHGIANPQVELTQVTRIDLDGDGADEVLVSGTRRGGDGPGGVRPGDYSFVFLRKLVDGKVMTTPIVTDLHPDPKPTSFSYRLDVVMVLDLNGDGTMEIVTSSEFYEGVAVAVLTVDGLDVKQVLIVGCGA